MKVLNTKNLLLYSFMFSSVFFFTKNECLASRRKRLLKTPIPVPEAQNQPIVQNQTIAQQPRIVAAQNQITLPKNNNEQQNIENLAQLQNINNDEEIIRQIVLEEIRPLTTIQGNRIDKYKAKVINVERGLEEQIRQQAILTGNLNRIIEQINQQTERIDEQNIVIERLKQENIRINQLVQQELERQGNNNNGIGTTIFYIGVGCLGTGCLLYAVHNYLKNK